MIQLELYMDYKVKILGTSLTQLILSMSQRIHTAMNILS